MANEDKIKWDKKYENTPKLLEDRNPSKKLESLIQLTSGKQALEIACGTGRNSIYLAKNGFNVDAYDIAQIALDKLNSYGYNTINTKLADLDDFEAIENNYDLIVQTNFLDRKLIPKLLSSLKQNGLLFIETYMDHPSNTKPNSNPDFLLQKGELKSFVSDRFKVIDYDEFDNEPTELYRMKKQSIIIQKC